MPEVVTAAVAIVLRVAAVPVKEQQPVSSEKIQENCMRAAAAEGDVLQARTPWSAKEVKAEAAPVDGLVTLDREQQRPRLVLLIQAAVAEAVSMLPAMV